METAREHSIQLSDLERCIHGNMGKTNAVSQGFLKADAAPMTTAKTMPRPAPTEAPTAAAVNEDAFA
jgi:hypothetical protein